MESKKIMGVRVDFGMSMDDVVDTIENKLMKDGKNHIICTTNPEFIMDAKNDEAFRDIINTSSLSVPDGVGVVLAHRYLDEVKNLKKNIFIPFTAFWKGIALGIHTFINGGDVLRERISGVDLTYKLCELSSKKGYTIFFLGGRYKNAVGKFEGGDARDMSIDAAKEMKKLYPGVNIIGATSKFGRGQEDDQDTLKFINDVMKKNSIHVIDFLFVAYNHNYQEKWIMRNKDKIPAKISIGCGGTFDYIVRNCSLPTSFYTKKNLGWLYRVLKQPWRAKRVFRAFPLFPMIIYLYSLFHK